MPDSDYSREVVKKKKKVRLPKKGHIIKTDFIVSRFITISREDRVYIFSPAY